MTAIYVSWDQLEAKFDVMALVSGEFSSLYQLHFFYQMFGVLLHQGSVFSKISTSQEVVVIAAM